MKIPGVNSWKETIIIEHDIVLSYAGADCFSIFRMSVVGLSSVTWKKKDIVVSRVGGTASKNCMINY